MSDIIQVLSEKAKASLASFFEKGGFQSSLGGYSAQPTDTAPTDPTNDPGEPTKLAPIIDQEFGVSQESYYTKFELQQYSPDDLVNSKGFRIFERMYQDDQIHMALTSIKLMRLSSGFEIVEASQDAQDIEIADFVADVFTKIEGSLTDVLFNLMGSLEMGWSLNEKIWDFYKVGPWTGKVRLKALKSKNPRWFNPTVDDFNAVTGIAMISPPAYGRKLPADKFIVYSFMKRYENVFGYSRIRALYDWWWVKQVTRRALGVFIEKFGHPIAIGKYPINMQSGHRKDLLTALRQIKIASAITMPDGCTVDFLEASKQGAEAFLQTIEKCDQQIVKVIMGQTMSSGTSSAHSSGAGGGAGGAAGAGAGKQGGAMAMDVLNMYLEYIGKHLAENPIAILIKELVDYNWSGITNYPTFKFKPLSEKDLSSSVEIWIKAATAMVGAAPAGKPGADGKPGAPAVVGTALVTSGPEDEEFIREILGFPAVQNKNALRPNRYLNRPKPITISPRVISPLELPWAGYRPSTPSGPGKAANYAEGLWKPSRKLTKYEACTDFAEALNAIEDDGVKELLPKVGAALRAGIDGLLKKMQKEKIVSGKKIGAVNDLAFRGRAELGAIFFAGMKNLAKDGMRAARSEIRQKVKIFKGAEGLDIQLLSPDQVMQFLKERSYGATDRISADALEKVKQEIYNGIKMGKSDKDVADAIEKALAPYFDAGAADEDYYSGPRLETAIRTISSEAYNEGRRSVMTDPDVKDIIPAFQYAAILDARTTEYCAEMDEGIYAAEDPIWDEATPPNHFNCRSMLIPITIYEDYELSDPPKVHPDEGFK